MPDKKNKRNPPDSARINVHEEYEVQYWKEHFGITKEELIQAVRAVGDSAGRVSEYLKSSRKKRGKKLHGGKKN